MIKKKKDILKWTKEKVDSKLGNSKHIENTCKILRMRPVHPM